MSELVIVNITMSGIEASGSNNSHENVTVSPPLATSATDKTESGFTANFEKVDADTEYLIFILLDDQDIPLDVQILSGNETTYDVTGLSINTTYKYKLKAIKQGVISEDSNVIEVLTLGYYDWNYSNIGKGFYLNFASNDGTNVTIETVSNMQTLSNPYFNYKGANFDGNPAQGIHITDTLHAEEEEYTKLTIKLQTKPNNFDWYRALISKGCSIIANSFEYRLLFLDANTLLLVLYNYYDYAGDYLAFNLTYSFNTSTIFNLILSIDLTDKLKTCVINGVDYSNSFSTSGTRTFANWNKNRANAYGEVPYDIGITDAFAGWAFNGLIWRPYTSTSEFVTTSQAIAEMARFEG